MSKNYFLAIFVLTIFSIGNGFAQGPTLTFANSGHIPGDVISQYSCDTVGVLPGSSGGNVNWDFSSLTHQGAPIVQNIVTTGSTPYSSTFPTATCASTGTSGGSQYAYYSTNSSHYQLIGLGNAYYTMTYTSPETIFQYPVSYNADYTNNIAASYTMYTMQNFRYGYSRMQADGYGTLKIPGQTINNVLRLKYTQKITDSSAYSKSVFYSTNYTWYDGIHKNAILAINLTTTVTTGGTSYGKMVMLSSDFVGIEPSTLDEALQTSIFPNPAQTEVTINFNEPLKENVKYEIVNSIGQIILTGNIGANLWEVNLNVQNLNKGLYYIHFTTNKSNVTKKILIE